MILLDSYNTKKILVVGFGKTGFSSARSLRKSGADIYIWDDNNIFRDLAIENGFTIFEYKKHDINTFDEIIWSPGVPHSYPVPHPIAQEAKKVGVRIKSDIDLLFQGQNKASYYCISGTNGKSTTTVMVAHILKNAGKNIQVGGNLGRAVLDLEPLGHDGIYILEISSFQSELLQNFKPTISALLNISPDHIDRHGSMDGYVNAKAQLFKSQSQGSIAIINDDDEYCRNIKSMILRNSKLEVISISVDHKVTNGIFVESNILKDSFFEKNYELDLSVFNHLYGRHNNQNIAFAYTISKICGIKIEEIIDSLSSFHGLSHRQEIVGQYSNILFINDSKATNWASALQALSSYNNIYWVAGGISKGSYPEDFKLYSKNIKKAFLIGQSANEISDFLNNKNIPNIIHSSLEDATLNAWEQANRDNNTQSTILLSPACASMDMFKNFEERGEAFVSYVKKSFLGNLND
ncbi:MAG: UDP-N-acetylmuramoyl-L-alanine--D-glutamate ligase [Alphaproteobacteria bacterium TMED87]|nr:MAG: UDP-N-acetylmuramoyl-L-alanine--D-glutamate ligase [Alphaproteobacteria bacterium TMED87]